MIGLVCSTLSCDGFLDRRFETSIAILPDIGYRYVELNCWHPSDLMPARIREAKRRFADAGVQPIAVYGSAFGAAAPFEISKDVCHKLRMIDAALELGCSRVVATGARRGEAGGLNAILRALEQIVPYAEQNGALIALENHANNNIESIEDYRTVFEEIPSDNLGACLDTGHFDASGIDPLEVVEALHTKVNHIHVKEALAKGVETFVRFGEGVTDNDAVIRAMIGKGYRGYISVELGIADKTNVVHDVRVPYERFRIYETAGSSWGEGVR